MKFVALISACLLALGVLLGGADALGRVLLAFGQNKAASLVFQDTAWQGVARYRAGAFDDAAQLFAKSELNFNRGNAAAHMGEYAAALEAYDMAMVQGHPNAQANFDLVAAHYAGLAIDPEALALFAKRENGPQMDSFIGQGNGRASGTGSDATNTNTMLGLAELDSRGRLGVRRVFDDQFMVADDRWLSQLSDVPGEYLKARITFEHKRRSKLGLSPEPPEDPQ